MNMDIAFCRLMLQETHVLVKRHFPEINLRKDAWVWCAGRNHWEFHGPSKYYWHGNASNAYQARYKGWLAWLESKGVGEEKTKHWR
jgi:hypothetical protein